MAIKKEIFYCRKLILLFMALTLQILSIHELYYPYPKKTVLNVVLKIATLIFQGKICYCFLFLNLLLK